MRLHLLALSLIFVVAAPAGFAKGNIIFDTDGPTFTLKMNDGNRAGPIAWEDSAVPPALGCNGNYNEAGWNPGWDEIYPGTDFFDPVVHGLTYFFKPNLQDIGRITYILPNRFTVRANDVSGIKRIEIRIVERNVITNQNGVVDDGPTEFSDISDPDAYAYLIPLYFQGGQFSHWEKRLEWNRPAGSHFVGKTLRFSLNTFGHNGRVRVIVEDLRGNISEDSVYLADEGLCD